jgi:hypothetical protein
LPHEFFQKRVGRENALAIAREGSQRPIEIGQQQLASDQVALE